VATQTRVAESGAKRVCYLSMEYLPGRSLPNAVASLGQNLEEETRTVLAGLGFSYEEIVRLEPDPGLGNGGLGRLAACYLDSLATLHYPAVGYGIRFDYGIFEQVIDDEGAQQERASSWLRVRNPWESPRTDARYRVHFGGRCSSSVDADGRVRHQWVDTQDVYAVAFDQLVPGNRSATVNHLRLWSGRAVTPFHVQVFNAGRYAEAVAEQIDAKNLSRILYPDDSTPQGKELRFRQQYFFVSASLQDLLATHLGEGRALEALADSWSIQLNDTHPALAVPELALKRGAEPTLVGQGGAWEAVPTEPVPRVVDTTAVEVDPELAAAEAMRTLPSEVGRNRADSTSETVFMSTCVCAAGRDAKKV
jgi:starch phosphorylase